MKNFQLYGTMIKVKRTIFNFFTIMFNTKIKKVVNLAAIGFFCGVGLAALTITTITKMQNRTGVGGFESQTSPDLSMEIIEDLDSLLEDSLAVISEESTPIEPPKVITNKDVAAKKDEPKPSIETKTDLTELTYKTYRIKQGDQIGYIAAINNVTSDTLTSVNNIKAARTIQPGQYLKIPSISGILYTVKNNDETFEKIAAKYDIDAEKCATVNKLELTASLKSGATLFLPDAQLDWETRQEINGDLFRIPLKNKYYLSSNYGWRDSPFNTGKRTFHGGIDMACGKGNTIYASMPGKVTFAGYNETYGNYVIVEHHSGYKTLYGHMSKITCKKGQFVDNNTKLGEVGSTGMSTGNHLHFTVYKNGKSMNPMSVLN